MSIPKHAKRVFKGKIFEIYQWRQKMFDGSVEIFEKARRPDTVIVIATMGSKLVCLKQKQPTGWFMSTPSGRMDVPGETPKQAALRELLEETGMKPKKLIFWKKMPKYGKVLSNIYFFIARDCEKVTTQKLDPGEKIQVKLLNFEEFLKLPDTEADSHWLGETLIDMYKARLDKKYKKYLKNAYFGKK